MDIFETTSRVVDMPTIEGYFTVAEAAIELDLSESRIRHLIRDNRIASKKVGGIHLIASDEIQRFKSIKRSEGWPKGKSRK